MKTWPDYEDHLFLVRVLIGGLAAPQVGGADVVGWPDLGNDGRQLT
jgi:hypothetical protein